MVVNVEPAAAITTSAPLLRQKGNKLVGRKNFRRSPYNAPNTHLHPKQANNLMSINISDKKSECKVVTLYGSPKIIRALGFYKYITLSNNGLKGNLIMFSFTL